MTSQQIELENKLRDPRRRLNAFYYIVNKQKQQQLFIENKIQRIYNNNATRFDIILKARQFGISTNILLKLLDKALFNHNTTAVILAHEQDAIKKLFRIVRYGYDNTAFDKPELDRGGGSKYELFFPEINSRIYVDLESRSDTISDLHISEMAFMKNRDRVDATMDAVPVQTGNISIETTANGLNHFYDFYNEPGVFKTHFFPWFLHHEYQLPVTYSVTRTPEELVLCKKALKFGIEITDEQISFRRFKIQQKGRGGLQHFMQEYPEDDETCFLLSGQQVIDRTLLKSLLESAPVPSHQDKEVTTYDHQDSTFVCGVDTAEGVDGDYCVAIMFDAKNMEVVGKLRGRWKAGLFAKKIVEFCGRFVRRNVHPLIAVERNNHGHAVLLALNDIEQYPNLYKHKDDKLGWLTDKITRPIMLNSFMEGAENQTIKLNDKILIKECLTLINNGGKIEADGGKHDDCVMACAIALQVSLNEHGINIYDNIDSYIRI